MKTKTVTTSNAAAVEVLETEPISITSVQSGMTTMGVRDFMLAQVQKGTEALYNLCVSIRLYLGEERPASDGKKVHEVAKWLGQSERTVVNNWRVGEFTLKHNLALDDLRTRKIPISVIQAKGPKMLKAADLKEAVKIAHEKPEPKIPATPAQKAKDAERKASAALDASEDALTDKEKATALFTQIAPAVLPHFAQFVTAVGSPLKAVEALDTLITRFLELAATAKSKKPAAAKS